MTVLAGTFRVNQYISGEVKGIGVKNGIGAFAHPDGLVRLHEIEPGKKYTVKVQPPVVVEARDVCQLPTCYVEIKTMCYKGTGACCELHRKRMAGEIRDNADVRDGNAG